MSKNTRFPLFLAFLFLGAIHPAWAQSIYTPYLFTTVVGNPPGSSDGTGAAAHFDGPFALAISPLDGAIYLADSNNNTIRKCSRPGAAVTTFAGMAGAGGSADGFGGAARFFNPKGVAFDALGNLFVADSSNNTIRKIDPQGKVTTFAGLAGVSGSADGTGSAARFNFPTGVAVGPDGDIFVADFGNNTIREIDSDGDVSTLAGRAGKTNYVDAPLGIHARFHAPTGLTVDAFGKIYVADTDNFVIRIVDSQRRGATTTLAGTPQIAGSADGQGMAAQFNIPSGVVVNPTTLDVYVADTFNQAIRKIDAQGNVTTLAGLPALVGSADGQGSAARFDLPRGLTFDGSNIFVADTLNNTIREIDPAANVTTFAGSGSSGNDDGPVATARLTLPNGIAFDSANNMYIAEPRSQVIRKVSVAGVVSTFAGTLHVAGSADGIGVQAQFDSPTSLAVDSHDNVYVTDKFNNTIRMITPDQVVTTIAGAPLPAPPGDANGPGVDARFYAPTGLAFDSNDNLYVTDTNNEAIRLITPDADHTVSLLAGQGIKGSANGQGTTAQFSGPSGIAVGRGDNIFVTDMGNNSIRQITPAGLVSTLAGTAGVGAGTADGPAAGALFHRPSGIAVDAGGNIYIADFENDLMRKISAANYVTTLAGSPDRPGGAQAPGPLGRFHYPFGVAVDRNDNVYVSDFDNHTVRIGQPAPPVITSPASAQGLVGQQFVYRFTAAGADSLSVAGLPPGLTFDPTAKSITGKPDEAGTTTVTLSARNGRGTTTQTLLLTIGTQTMIGNRTAATGAIGQLFNFAITGGPALSPTAIVTVAGLPPGLSFNNRTGVIAGTVPMTLATDDLSQLVTETPAQAGSSLVTITATDHGVMATSTLQLDFTENPKVPVITSDSLVYAMPGKPFSYQIETLAPATSYTLMGGGPLPPGLRFNPSKGIISGTYQGVADSQEKEILGRGINPNVNGGDIANIPLFANNPQGIAALFLGIAKGPPGSKNISVRSLVGTGEDVGIAGFTLTGNAPKEVLIRGLGPSLSARGVTGVLSDPVLQLHEPGGKIITNDNWRDTQESAISNTGIPPTNDNESAILAYLPSNNANYTVTLTGKNGATGVGLVEVYDQGTATLAQSSQAQTANISARGKVGPGEDVLISGFIIPQGTHPNVLIRGRGPSLDPPIRDPLPDPVLILRNSDGTAIASNDDWQSSQKEQIIATRIPPKDPREAAILKTLGAGDYTAILTGKNGATGVGLVEIYVLH